MNLSRKMKWAIDHVRKHETTLRIEHILKGKDGRLYPYIKEIKEVPGIIIIRLKGDIDSKTIPIVNDDLDDIMERYLDKHVLLDFKDVTHVDTSTLAGMIILLDKLQKKRRKLGIVNTAAHLEDYFAIGKIGSLMHVYGSEESAFSDMMKQ